MLVDAQEAAPGPVTPAARALGPDLARGFMLLFIALANTHYFLRSPSILGGYPQDGSLPDRALIWLLTTLVDGRAFPMFGLLFGYGVARIAHRHLHRGTHPTGDRPAYGHPTDDRPAYGHPTDDRPAYGHPTHHSDNGRHPADNRPGNARRRAANRPADGSEAARRPQPSDRWRIRRMLWRRAAALIVIGLADAVLFYVGDILAAYGVLLLFGALMIFWRDRWLLATAAVFLTLNSLPNADLSTISPAGPDAAMLPPTLSALIPERLPVALFIAALGPLGFLCPFALGLWAGRRRILEHPAQHRPLLLRAATIGIAAAILGAQPIALLLSGATVPASPSTLEWLATLHSVTGLLGGLGYAALFALLALHHESRPDHRVSAATTRHADGRPAGERPDAVVRAIAAAGQRSMTCYLMQSVAWAVMFTPFLLDLSGALTVTSTALLASATWIATDLIADRLRATGRRGPFEALTRHITYRRPRQRH
jgi:uncharacterized protein